MKSAARATCAPARGRRPRERVQPVPDGDPHQLVPRRMELDLVDPLAEAVVRPQLRRMLVREPPPLERLAVEQRPERRTALGRPARAFALERLDERSIRREEVVTGERGRLVRGCGGWKHRHPENDMPRL